MVGSILIKFNNSVQRVSTGSMTDKDKKELWDNREQYMNKEFECKGMLSDKNKIRHPTFFRWRKDKNETLEDKI